MQQMVAGSVIFTSYIRYDSLFACGVRRLLVLVRDESVILFSSIMVARQLCDGYRPPIWDYVSINHTNIKLLRLTNSHKLYNTLV